MAYALRPGSESVVDAVVTINTTRADHTAYPAYNQEMPAVYVNGFLDQCVLCCGDADGGDGSGGGGVGGLVHCACGFYYYCTAFAARVCRFLRTVPHICRPHTPTPSRPHTHTCPARFPSLRADWQAMLAALPAWAVR
jgi:hypothetical protein